VVFQRLNLAPERYPPFKEELLERLRGIQGVQSGCDGADAPFRGDGSVAVSRRATERDKDKEQISAELAPATSRRSKYGCWRAREFNARIGQSAERGDCERGLARRFAAGANSRRTAIPNWAHGGLAGDAYEIVGLVRDTKYTDLREEFTPIAYTRPRKTELGAGWTDSHPIRLHESEIVAQVRRVLNENHPSITVSFQSFQSIVESTTLRER